MTYIAKNKEKFDFAGITHFWNKGFTGKGVKLGIVFDDYNAETSVFEGKVHAVPELRTGKLGVLHGFKSAHTNHQIAPELDIYFLPYAHNIKPDFEDGINWAIENGINIISMSFQGSNEEWFKKASQKAIDNGIILICSAGNNGLGSTGNADNTLGYTAKDDIWISIGAVDLINGKLVKLDSSSVGDQLDFCGLTNIYVGTDFNNPLVYSQTSCATQVVVSMLSLWMQWYKEKYNKCPNQEIAYEFMKNNCIDLQDDGFDKYTGNGLFKLPNPDELSDDFMFKDINNVSAWAKESVLTVEELGLMNGDDLGNFNPKNNLTREEFAVVINNLLEYLSLGK